MTEERGCIRFPLRCISGFALPIRTVDEIRLFCEVAGEHDINAIRMGSESSDWRDKGFFGNLRGPEPFSDAWKYNLLKALDTTASMGMAVELVVLLTVKGIDRPREWQRKYVHKVGNLVRRHQFRHVIFSACNEPTAHTNFSKPKDVNRFLKILRPYGRLVTVDAPGGPRHGGWDWDYDQSLVDFVSFHPQRNPEPNRASFKEAERKFGRVFYDEIVCYANDDDPYYNAFRRRSTMAQGTQKQRREQVQRVITDAEAANAWVCFHSLNGMSGRPDKWYPKWRRR